MMRSYTLGDALAFSTVFFNAVTNVPQNPTTVILRLLDPNGVEYRPIVNNTNIGAFIASYTPTVAGMWHSRWESNGSIQTAIEHEFEIKPSAFNTGQ